MSDDEWVQVCHRCWRRARVEEFDSVDEDGGIFLIGACGLPGCRLIAWIRNRLRR